jgi:hypothetical protein
MCDTRNLGRSSIRPQEQGILNCDKNGAIKLQWKEIKKNQTPVEGTKKQTGVYENQTPVEVTKKPKGAYSTKNQNQQYQYPKHLLGIRGKWYDKLHSKPTSVCP